MSAFNVPKRREDFTVAIVCALSEESDAMRLLLDEEYDRASRKYPKVLGDKNLYTNGRIGRHNIVICQAKEAGKAAAASIMSSMWTSYTKIEIVLIVGICGALPSEPGEKHVIISQSMKEHDRGKALEQGFKSTTIVKEHNREVSTLLKLLESEIDRPMFETVIVSNLIYLQSRNESYKRPCAKFGPHEQQSSTAVEPCDKGKAVSRELVVFDRTAGVTERDPTSTRQGRVEVVQFHLGRFASGDQVVKSAEFRDNLAREHEVIAYEMEGPGAWDYTVPCIIIKGLSDFADAYKNDEWRKYSCATGASAAKAFLTKFTQSLWAVPFSRNPDFVGRDKLIRKLRSKILSPEGPKTIAVFALGGIGKTDLAAELLHQMGERSYENILQALVVRIDDPSETRKHVATHLESSVTKWLLLLDNVDSRSIWEDLEADLPKSKNGQVLITTRNRSVVLDAYCDIVEAPEPSEETATTSEFLKRLTRLPLAIAQAASYLRRNENIGLFKYMELFEKEESDDLALLDTGLHGGERYLDTSSPVATTWLISFSQISDISPLAAIYLKLMACVRHHKIPESFFPQPTSEKEKLEAVGDLLNFSFVTARDKSGPLTMHRLVRLATRNWMRKNQEFTDSLNKAANRVCDLFPSRGQENRQMQHEYLPHAMSLLSEKEIVLDDHPWLLEKVAYGLSGNSRYSEALRLFTKLFELRKKCIRHRNPALIVDSMASIVTTYKDLGQFEKAEEMAIKALKMSKDELGEEHEDTIFVEVLLASIYKMQGRWGEAEELNRHAINVQTRIAANHRNTLDYMAVAGLSYQVRRKTEEAEITLSQLLSMREETLGPDHLSTVDSMVALASLPRLNSLLDKAKGSFARLIKIAKLDNKFNHSKVIHIGSQLASTCQKLQEPKEAEKLVGQSLEMA
ncbi:uncharacterized protein DSM5745_03795 [Aspergillus mulundensis]|uniref:Nucleoside phosphorylase domain-containing protein n=1 Tax=Aspergillus mulundensis TaxID=1810919 RepID=A0A3D8SLG7_9EURO|nr:hypothetical protein DSM5745_03795 [Aspergillus mulundensis]RDW87153.1 hypothetical protein DSM5745_03795 [Aspergillus mulundensis]